MCNRVSVERVKFYHHVTQFFSLLHLVQQNEQLKQQVILAFESWIRMIHLSKSKIYKHVFYLLISSKSV